MIDEIRASLAADHDDKLVDELLAAYGDAKAEFYLGGLRLQAVEGGRFCEAAFRLLEEETTGSFTPLGKQVNTDSLIRTLGGLPAAAHPDAIRLHIPRTLRVIYDIRNKRDAAHLADGIDPNLQDATLVVACLDWVLAEFVRLWHKVSPHEAQEIVEDLVTRRVPVIQDFDGFLKVLKPDLTRGQHVLALLYQRGAAGATVDQLRSWARPAMRKKLMEILERLEHQHNYVHRTDALLRITERGRAYVEESDMLQPE